MDLFIPYSLFLLQNTIVIVTSFVLTAVFMNYKVKDGYYFFFLLTLIFFGLIFIPQIILGVFGVLDFWPLFGSHLVISFSVLSLFYRKFLNKFSFDVTFPSMRVFLIFLLFFTPIIAIVGVRFLNALYQVPVEYDNLAYHLPFVVEWLKTSDLTNLYYSAFAGPVSYYPSNFELLDLYVMLPFGKDYLVNFINFPLFVFICIAVYGTFLRMKVGNRVSIAVGALAVSMPVVMRQLGVPLVDLLFLYLFVVSMYFLVVFSQTRNPIHLLPFSFAIGLFAGTKYLGLVYGAVPLFFALCFLFFWFWKYKKKFFKYLSYSILLFLLGGGFWYLRNFISTGNPLFPVEISLFGDVVLKGYGPISDNLYGFSLLANVVDMDGFRYFFHGLFSMVGPQVYLVFIILFGGFFASFYFLYLSLWKHSQTKFYANVFAVSLLLFIVQVFYLLLYFRAPYSYNNLIPNVRYGLMFLFFGFGSLGYIIYNLRIKFKYILMVMLPLLWWNLVSFVLYPSEDILNNDKLMIDLSQVLNFPFMTIAIFVYIFLLFAFFYFLQETCTIGLKKLCCCKLVVSFLLLGFLSFFLFQKTYMLREDMVDELYATWYGDYPDWYNILKASEWLNDNAYSAKIAYTGFNFHYHLYGRELQREVDYVNINDCFECRYKDFALDDSSIRRDPNYDNWLDNLQKLGKEYVVVEPEITENVYNNEFNWMQEHDDKFEQVFNEGSTYIFKVL